MQATVVNPRNSVGQTTLCLAGKGACANYLCGVIAGIQAFEPEIKYSHVSSIDGANILAYLLAAQPAQACDPHDMNAILTTLAEESWSRGLCGMIPKQMQIRQNERKLVSLLFDKISDEQLYNSDRIVCAGMFESKSRQYKAVSAVRYEESRDGRRYVKREVNPNFERAVLASTISMAIEGHCYVSGNYGANKYESMFPDCPIAPIPINYKAPTIEDSRLVPTKNIDIISTQHRGAMNLYQNTIFKKMCHNFVSTSRMTKGTLGDIEARFRIRFRLFAPSFDISDEIPSSWGAATPRQCEFLFRLGESVASKALDEGYARIISYSDFLQLQDKKAQQDVRITIPEKIMGDDADPLIAPTAAYLSHLSKPLDNRKKNASRGWS